MKKLILITVFFLLGICQAQQAIYISHQPVDMGIGVRYDYNFFYGSFSYGDWGIYRYYNLTNHFKATAGIGIRVPDFQDWHYRFNIGLNYHHVTTDVIPEFCVVNMRIMEPLSFELGLTVYMWRLAIGMRTDILRWEPCVDIGFLFSKLKYKHGNIK